MQKLFVISLGGSLINPGQIDVGFLKNFRKLILEQTKKGSRFILIVGGGRPAREYIAALNVISKPSADYLDWMGIAATRFNAQLVRLMLGQLSHGVVIEDPNKKVNFKEKVLLAGGWMPGRSTDDDAVRLAKVYEADCVINLSNIDYVYTKDPRKFKDAQVIKEISWKNFRKIVGNKWDPGKNLPFDPTAAKLAEKNKLMVVIANGKNLKNLKNILEEKKFKGTVIK
ncbi:MAG TPA: UMP kinase [Candidatus Limnocylindria bacterium]|nr:UMP kinase [Candidatus Limnocylindria bacterium]